MPKSPDLQVLQNWFQTFIVDPAADEDVFRGHEKQANQWIKPTPDLSAVERVDIYRGQYLLRMEEALAADFPGVKHFLGEHAFEHFVYHYVQAHPSRSYNLSRLAEDVPGFFSASDYRRKGFLADMARLELTVCQVFDAPSSAPLTQEAVAAVPEEAWGQARVQTVAALRLLDLSYPVNAYLTAVQTGTPLPSTARTPNHLVVWRHRYDMWRMAISKAEYRLLSALQAGSPLGDALWQATRGRDRLDAQEVFRAFSRWVGEGFFSEIHR
ncbi:MAG TPA: DNA-binding domain-containing protein [Candidatus Xenobia bacterium]|jgi:hypothetical protein